MENADRTQLYEAKIVKEEKRRKDKSDIATVDKVLDPKTIKILNKLSARNKLTNLSGCFSSGKEANIYTADCSTQLSSKFIGCEASDESFMPAVLKIYKTSTMMFKDRTRYIIDEKRFARFCKNNSRKLIEIWSQKEVRNLKRLNKHGILSPRLIYLKKSILILSMIGDKSPAIRLRDIVATKEEWQSLYLKAINIIKDMYQKARLIHADFSEYNVLYHKGDLYVIDVSQSMEINQENSNTFLIMDICNCNDFFLKKQVDIISEISIFEDVTKLKVPEHLKVDGKLNKDCFIPTRIADVSNAEDLGIFFANIKISNEADLGLPADAEEESCSIASEEIDKNDASEVSSTELEITIDVNIRNMRKAYPKLTEEKEKLLNKERKMIVKEKNKERRVERVQRKKEYEQKNKNKKKNNR